MKFPPPLRFALPGVMLLFGLIGGCVYYYFEAGRRERAVEDTVTAQARHLGRTLANLCPFLIENNLPAGAQRGLALSMTQGNLRLAHALDGGRKILFSTRDSLKGRSVEETSIREYLPLIERSRERQNIQIETTQRGSVLTAAFPFELKPGASGSFTPGTGVIFLEYDLASPKAVARAGELRDLGVAGGVLFVFFLTFTFLFDRLLTARVRRLADASAKLAAGQLDARAGLKGGDEVASLSKAFDEMATQFQARDTDLRESEARFRFLVESIPQVFWLTQASPERVLYIAPAFEKIWGSKVGELYRNPRLWVDAIHPDDRNRVVHAFEEWLTGKAPNYEVTYRVVRPDGEMRWVRDRGTHRGKDRPLRVAGFAEDISEEMRTAGERERIERKLQDTQRLESLGVLAGGIAHDFNNLLTGMLGNASLARMMIPQSDGAQVCLAEIEETARRAAELCKQMLAYSGKGRFVAQLVNLNSLMDECAQLLQISITKNAVFRFDLARELPQIVADPTQIRQVVMNLVINASEAIGGKSGVIGVSTGVARIDSKQLATAAFHSDLREGDYVFLEVADNGCGMDSEMLERIFDPFFTTKFTGRGLGLSSVLGIVRSHQGGLALDSRPGQGSTFRLFFPIAKGQMQPNAKGGVSPKGQWGTGVVLVADDEETVRAVAARMLESFGFTPLLACDGSEALDRFRASRNDIVAVLLDLTMPHMDGEETLRRLREIDPGMKVILMSGFGEQEALDRFSGSGLSGFLQKPFTPDALAAKLQFLVRVASQAAG